MASLRTWFRATQPHSFVASLVGVALGTAVAWNSTRIFDLVAFLLATIGVVCLHAATNMSNDSIDFKRGVDDLPAHLVSPFTGGARVLPDAAVSFEAHRRVWIGFFAAAALIGIVLALLRPNGWILLVLGGIGGAIGVFYTLPPSRSSTPASARSRSRSSSDPSWSSARTPSGPARSGGSRCSRRFRSAFWSRRSFW